VEGEYMDEVDTSRITRLVMGVLSRSRRGLLKFRSRIKLNDNIIPRHHPHSLSRKHTSCVYSNLSFLRHWQLQIYASVA